MTAVWAILAFLIGWKLATAASGHPAAAVSSASSTAKTAASTAKTAVHQVITQASNDLWATIWTVVWHLALVAVVLGALVWAGSVLLRRARQNVTGHR